MTRKHRESIGIVEQLALLCLKSFGEAHERRKYCVFLATPIDHTHIRPCAFCSCARLFVCVGKGRHQASATDAAQRAGYVLYRALV